MEQSEWASGAEGSRESERVEWKGGRVVLSEGANMFGDQALFDKRVGRGSHKRNGHKK